MKKEDFWLFVLIAMLFLPIILFTKVICDFEDFQTQVAAEKIIQNEKIKELEKEIRILKTDVQIIQCGFEDKDE
mgnify:CR=1 FL=1